jgi:hypothetical protein
MVMPEVVKGHNVLFAAPTRREWWSGFDPDAGIPGDEGTDDVRRSVRRVVVEHYDFEVCSLVGEHGGECAANIRGFIACGDEDGECGWWQGGIARLTFGCGDGGVGITLPAYDIRNFTQFALNGQQQIAWGVELPPVASIGKGFNLDSEVFNISTGKRHA